MRSRHAHVEVIVPNHHLSHAPQLKQALFTHAADAWRSPNHPGWGLYTFQGRRTSRMPPQGAGSYASDPTNPPCYTPPDPNADATTNTGGRRDASSDQEHECVADACGQEDTFTAPTGPCYAEGDLDPETPGQARPTDPCVRVFAGVGINTAEANTSAGTVGADVGMAARPLSCSLEEWMPDAPVPAGDDLNAFVGMHVNIEEWLESTGGGPSWASGDGALSGVAATTPKGPDVSAGYSASLAAHFSAAAAWEAPELPYVEGLEEFDTTASMGAAPPPPPKPSAEPPPAQPEWCEPQAPAAAAKPLHNWMDTFSLAAAVHGGPAGGGGGAPGGSIAAAAVAKAVSERRRMRSQSIELDAEPGPYKRPRGEPAEKPTGVMWCGPSS